MQISQSTSNGLFDWILKYHSPVLTTLYFCQILIINQLFLSYRTWLIYTEPSQFLVITSLLAEDRWMLYKFNVGISESIKNSSKTVTVINYYQILMTFSGILSSSLTFERHWFIFFADRTVSLGVVTTSSPSGDTMLLVFLSLCFVVGATVAEPVLR